MNLDFLTLRTTGHWIQSCPHSADPTFGQKPRLKRTTGIPKSFLKVVDLSAIKDKPSGVMVSASGELVVAMTNEEGWNQYAAKNKYNVGIGDLYEMAHVIPELECGICKKLLRDAVTVPCCGSKFCDECECEFFDRWILSYVPSFHLNVF